MAEMTFMGNHITSLTLPFLSLEVYADESLSTDSLKTYNALIQKAWPIFLYFAEEENLYETLALNLKRRVMEVELIWTNNATMEKLNQQYRQKEGPTDVLTFTLLADADDPELWMSLPVLQLGSIFISLEYAETAVKLPDLNQSLDSYLVERFIHGMLHLFGMHHDTMEKYDRVVAVQKQVLEAVFP